MKNPFKCIYKIYINVSKNIAVIPLRKGSKGIPGKNRKKLLGRPLYSWVLHEAIQSSLDKVYIYTDDEEIIQFVSNEYSEIEKLRIIERNPDDATDTASTEAAMRAFSEKISHNYDTITLLQATSPLTTHKDINQALSEIESGSWDSLISLVREKRFIWDNKGNSLNYDYRLRPRRQDFDGLLVENGAIYTSVKKQFLDSGIRIGGRIGSITMPTDTYVEIDEEDDFIIIEQLLKKRLIGRKGMPGTVKALVMDVDGVFTDGKITYGHKGELSKDFNMRDGMGLEILRENEVLPIVMTSEDSELVKARMKKLQIQDAFFGVKDKYHFLNGILQERKLKRSEIVYLGDDRNDLANILSCGWGICPNDAVSEVIENSDIRLNAKGGEMAIREVISFILNHNKRIR